MRRRNCAMPAGPTSPMLQQLPPQLPLPPRPPALRAATVRVRPRARRTAPLPPLCRRRSLRYLALSLARGQPGHQLSEAAERTEGLSRVLARAKTYCPPVLRGMLCCACWCLRSSRSPTAEQCGPCSEFTRLSHSLPVWTCPIYGSAQGRPWGSLGTISQNGVQRSLGRRPR